AALVRGGTAVYFDSAVAALVLATFGRYLEANARARASHLVGHLLEPSAKPVQVDGRATAPAAIEPGMTFRVAPGEVVPVDGRLLAPVEVSLGVLTGESAPVSLAEGDEVPAGATPSSGELVATALRPAKASTLETLARLAKGLREQRADVQRLADRLATWLTPLVAAVAIAALVFWGTTSAWPVGVETALAVVLVACPCTYGVITPLILWLTLRRALSHGVCIRNARVVEAMADVRVVSFDKTGTLTQPMKAVRMHRHGTERVPIAPVVAALEHGNGHPIARALAGWAGDDRIRLSDRRIVNGQGVVATDERGLEVALGSPRLLTDLGIAVPVEARARSALLSIDGEMVASFDVDEALRPEAPVVVASLSAAGIAQVILSGDRRARAARVGEALGVAAHGELTPGAKVAALRELGGGVAIVGDGVNDAPASAAAAIGFAVCGASGYHRGLADVTLLRDDLRLVVWTLELSRRASQLARRTLGAA
ncbi:MAG: HAD-IC family P-type ATPase, partial [Polyangiaceae bacterium]